MNKAFIILIKSLAPLLVLGVLVVRFGGKEDNSQKFKATSYRAANLRLTDEVHDLEDDLNECKDDLYNCNNRRTTIQITTYSYDDE
jgi:hypothetical protein